MAMELFEARDHFIIQNGEYALWCNRFDGSMTARRGKYLLPNATHQLIPSRGVCLHPWPTSQNNPQYTCSLAVKLLTTCSVDLTLVSCCQGCSVRDYLPLTHLISPWLPFCIHSYLINLTSSLNVNDSAKVMVYCHYFKNFKLNSWFFTEMMIFENCRKYLLYSHDMIEFGETCNIFIIVLLM